jgi:hypothetical protein
MTMKGAIDPRLAAFGVTVCPSENDRSIGAYGKAEATQIGSL